MAPGPATRISDVVVPENFTGYMQVLTEEKSRLVQSGALARSGQLDASLAGGGMTFNDPFWKDLDNDADRVSTDTFSDNFTGGTADPDPNKIESGTEVQIRLSRNNSWSTVALAGALAGDDPLTAIENRVGAYWARRLQAVFVATWNGVIADNALPPGGGEHVQDDLVHDISGGAYIPGETDFSAEAFIDAQQTMGDSQDNLSLVMMHSVVYSRAKKNNLIDFTQDSANPLAATIGTFLGHNIVLDDGMPNAAGVFDTWLFENGATQLGVGTPLTSPGTEIDRFAGAGNGAGQDVLYNRLEWACHPVGHAWVGATTASGGPDNATIAAAASWQRVYPERKQIGFARLVTREF